MEQRLLTSKQVTAMLGMSQSALRRNVARGIVPAPVRIGSRFIRWHKAEIEAYIASAERVEIRDYEHEAGVIPIKSGETARD